LNRFGDLRWLFGGHKISKQKCLITLLQRCKFALLLLLLLLLLQKYWL